MTTARAITAKKTTHGRGSGSSWVKPVLLVTAAVAAAFLAVFILWQQVNRGQVLDEAPEAPKILAMQSEMPFQILIPAYLPKEFDRSLTDVIVNESGPGGEPMVQITYRSAGRSGVFIKEWVPVNPNMEILNGSRPISTKWGKASLLTQVNLGAVWVDVGPLRVSIASQDRAVVPRETLVQIAESMGPASGRQVFNFVVQKEPVKEMAPPPPYEVPLNAQGVQEFTLTVTPGGYSPLRFQVKKGVPVKLSFRQLGQVGVGNTLLLPVEPDNYASLSLASETDKQVLEFTPQFTGEFDFHCAHYMYRGIMVVTD